MNKKSDIGSQQQRHYGSLKINKYYEYTHTHTSPSWDVSPKTGGPSNQTAELNPHCLCLVLLELIQHYMYIPVHPPSAHTLAQSLQHTSFSLHSLALSGTLGPDVPNSTHDIIGLQAQKSNA